MNQDLTERQKLIRDFAVAMIDSPGSKKQKIEAAEEYADMVLKTGGDRTIKRTYVKENGGQNW